MPRFSYMARDGRGVAVSGDVVAVSAMDASRLLRREGKFVVRIQAEREAEGSEQIVRSLGSRRVRSDEVVYFVNQIAAMVDTGVTIADALEAAIDRTPPGAFRRAVEDVIQRVQSGMDFSSALAAHPKVFPPLMSHMVRASEATGTLGKMLTRVADYITSQREIRKKIKGALIYPVCMLVFSIAATIFLIAFVLPKFTAIYASKQAVLPLPTRMLMATSNFFIDYWMYILIAAVTGAAGLTAFFRSQRGRYLADWLRLHMPIFGRMYRKACLARALSTMGTMIAAGVSVLDTVMITRGVVGNRLFARVFDDIHRKLEQGDQFSAALLEAPYFPRPVWQMLNAGERTGHLSQSMERVSEFCESDLRVTIRTMTQFIEPAMIVVMGSVIGALALAILLPIFQMSKVIAH